MLDILLLVILFGSFDERITNKIINVRPTIVRTTKPTKRVFVKPIRG